MNEERVYEILGIKIFRKLVFVLERFIHKGSEKKNVNYHLAFRNLSAIDQFIKFLFYNGSIHVRNVIYAAIYFIIRWGIIQITDYSPGVYSKVVNIIIVVLLVKDLYCIMLQRYNYLRILKRKEKLEIMHQQSIKRKTEQRKEAFSKNYDVSFRNNDIDVIRNMREKITKGELIFVSETELETLCRLNNAMYSRNT